MEEKFNPFDISAADTKKGLLDNYIERRSNSLRCATITVQGVYRHALKRINDKLTAAANVGYSDDLRVTTSYIDEIIVELTQARRHIADVEKCDAVISALNQINL